MEYGPAEFDVTHRFVASAVWQLPSGEDRLFGISGRGTPCRRLGVFADPDRADRPGSDDDPAGSSEHRRGAAEPAEPHRQRGAAGRQRTVDRWLDAKAFSISD